MAKDFVLIGRDYVCLWVDIDSGSFGCLLMS